MKKFELIPNWKSAHKLWSVQFAALGTALTSVLIAFPEAAIITWNTLPEPLKENIPPQLIPLIGVAVFALSVVGRILKQSEEEND